MATALPQANRRNVAAVAAVAALLVVGHVILPHWSTRYGSYLLAFAVWMAWFVEAVAAWLGEDA